jgi:hypothetical protein
MRYDSILDDRYERGRSTQFQRFSDADFNEGCVWDTRPLRQYQVEMQGFIRKIIKEYSPVNADELLAAFEKPKPPRPTGTPEEQEKDQKRYESEIKRVNGAIKLFGTNFNNMVMVDEGRQMMDIVRGNQGNFLSDKVIGLSTEEKLKNMMSLGMAGSGSPSTAAD